MIEFLVKTHDEKLYEISELVKSVSFTDKLNDGCSKLEFSYVDDNLNIENGNAISFKYNGTNIFRGFVFKHGYNKKKEVTITAYDQLRYAKAKDAIVILNDTATTLVNRMCNYFRLNKGFIDETGYKLKTKLEYDNTWLDIIYASIQDTLLGNGNWYVLRDEFGNIALRDMLDLKLNLILGDKSLCYDYEYSSSIDEAFYNRIIIYVEGDSVKNSQIHKIEDNESVDKYGRLQYFEVMKNSNVSQAKARADILLKLYNHETETFTLKCLGDTSVRAGSTFYCGIEDVYGANKLVSLFVKSVTHDFIPVHTMSLEVMI